MSEAVKIAIVDNDCSMCEAIKTLVEAVGLSAESFSSAEEFLNSQHAQDSKCLILDVRMPGMSGFELQRRLARYTIAGSRSSSLQRITVKQSERGPSKLARSTSYKNRSGSRPCLTPSSRLCRLTEAAQL
jgi:CheY-like chemotaxis protein